MSAFLRTGLALVITLPLVGRAAASAGEPPTFVGAQVCAGCHTAEFDAWKASHHALAMQEATAGTGLGNFADTQLEHFGVTTPSSATVTGSWFAPTVRMARCTNIRSPTPWGSIHCNNT